MSRKKIWQEIELELRRVKVQQPYWPEHIVSQAARVCEHPTTLLGKALSIKYEGEGIDHLREEMKRQALRSAAVAIRFLEELPESKIEKQ